MYLRTPKRYTAKGSKKPLISLRWLWLYLLAPIVVVISALAWDNRGDLSQAISVSAGRIKLPQLNAPTPTPTLPATDLKASFTAALKSGNLSSALDAMQSYTDALPNETQWHAVLAQTLILRSYSRDPDLMKQAQKAGLSAINANPEVVDGWISEALVLDWSNQSKQALSYALRAKDLGAANGMTSAVMAGIYTSLGDTNQATTLITDALKTNPNLAYAYYVQGLIAANAGDVKNAISAYKQGWEVSKADPMQWGGYIADILADAYATQNEFDAANALLVDALQRDNNDPELYYRQSKLYFQQGVYDKAANAAASCIDHNAKYLLCHEILTKLQYTLKEYDKAAQTAQTAISLGTVETSVYYFGGLADLKLNKCPDAIPMFQAGLTVAQKANKTSAISDFNEALGECGQGASLSAPATVAATESVTATPKKR